MQPSADDDQPAEGNQPNPEPGAAASAADAATVPQSGSLAGTELKEGAEAPFPLADAGPYYIGLWADHPNYKCPYCIYATLDGNGAVELHILERIDQGSVVHARALEKKGDKA